jgi:glutamate/tyrosine decarboxylase-like PLP-dependent enzyme
MPMPLPEHGRPWPELRAEMEAMRDGDLDWRAGRHAAFVWYANDDLEEVLREAFGMFIVENGLGVKVFPSIGRMEAEALAMVRSLLSGDDETASVMTSGGTESIFLAVMAAREWAREHKPHVREPEVVAPWSAHPALNKAAHLLGLRVTRVPQRDDFRADPEAMAAAISEDTIMLYASAPSYSLGLVDPVDAIGALAKEHDLWLHVDACVGGVLAPSVRELGYDVPPFDFAVEGVTSISADLHKSGFAAKPCSTVNFRTRQLREHARYTFDDWPSGIYSTLTFGGTRPGGAIAAAWAALNVLGQDGYRQIAAASMRAKEQMIEGLTSIPGVMVFGEPELWAFAFGHDEVDMHAVADRMAACGWYCGKVAEPRGIHQMCTPVHEPIAEEYVADIAAAIARVQSSGGTAARAASYT